MNRAVPILGIVWLPITVAVGSTALIYVFLIVAIRVFGRRQTGQLTVLDMLFILLLGSAVETGLIHGNATLPVGLASAATLLLMNRLITFALLRSKRLRHIVNGGPLLLAQDGRFIEEHLRRAGMTDLDAEEALRRRGYDGLSQVRYAVLETDGTVSVIPT
ncbi:MAG: hypothetical protein NVSMB57_13650 [Actinomycetota bacterium]